MKRENRKRIRLLTAHDVARLLRCSVQAVHLWRHARGLPYLTIENASDTHCQPAVRYLLPDVLEWAREQGREPDTAVLAELHRYYAPGPIAGTAGPHHPAAQPAGQS